MKRNGPSVQSKEQQCHRTFTNPALHYSLKRSTASGVPPSVLATACNALGPAVKEMAKARAQEIDSMRDHLLLHARKADRASVGAASLDLHRARHSTNSKASVLHRPPVSSATTTSRQRSPAINSAYFCALSARALWQVIPSSRAVPVLGSPRLVRAQRSVMSTANWAPWNSGRPDATTSMHRSSSRPHCDIHVPEFYIGADDGSCFAAHSCQGSLGCNGSGAQPARQWTSGPVPSPTVQGSATFARRVSHSQRQPQSLQDQGSEEFGVPPRTQSVVGQPCKTFDDPPPE